LYFFIIKYEDNCSNLKKKGFKMVIFFIVQIKKKKKLFSIKIVRGN